MPGLCYFNVLETLQDFIHSLKVLLGNHIFLKKIYIGEIACCIVIV